MIFPTLVLNERRALIVLTIVSEKQSGVFEKMKTLQKLKSKLQN